VVHRRRQYDDIFVLDIASTDILRTAAMTQLAPPPVPKALREALKDYPEYIQRIQECLNDVVYKPFAAMPHYEHVSWTLPDTITAFVLEASRELKTAQASGDPEAIARAEKKYNWMIIEVGGQAKRDALRELSTYFNAHKEATR